MNKFAISKYVPNKKMTNIPFRIKITCDNYIKEKDPLQDEKITTFNNESFSDFCIKNINPLLVYIKFYTLELINEKNNKTIGFAKIVFINTHLLIKDNIPMAYFINELFKNKENISICKYLEMFTDDNGFIENEVGNGNLFINNILISKELRNKGFGNYLIENAPIIMEKYIGLYFDRIMVPFNIILTKEDAKITNDNENELLKYINLNILIYEHLMDNNNYQILFQGENMECFCKEY